MIRNKCFCYKIYRTKHEHFTPNQTQMKTDFIVLQDLHMQWNSFHIHLTQKWTYKPKALFRTGATAQAHSQLMLQLNLILIIAHVQWQFICPIVIISRTNKHFNMKKWHMILELMIFRSVLHKSVCWYLYCCKCLGDMDVLLWYSIKVYLHVCLYYARCQIDSCGYRSFHKPYISVQTTTIIMKKNEDGHVSFCTLNWGNYTEILVWIHEDFVS